MRWVLERNILTDRQAGFRPGYSTTDNAFILDTLVERTLRRKEGKLFCGFIDFKTAFDGIPREALFNKLYSYGISHKFVRLLKSMYATARFAIKLTDDKISGEVKSTSGVLQGCQLSPLLFSLFINDLDAYMRFPNSHAPEIEGNEIPLLLYADDLIVLSSSPGGLQRCLDRLCEYCETWKMRINTDKSKVMIFKKGPLWKGKVFSLGGKRLECVPVFKYLGFVFARSAQASAS